MKNHHWHNVDIEQAARWHLDFGMFAPDVGAGYSVLEYIHSSNCVVVEMVSDAD